MIMIYNLQQSYTGRQMTAQQRQLSGTNQDGDNWGPWAVSIGPGRGGTLQHAQHSGPRLLRGDGSWWEAAEKHRATLLLLLWQCWHLRRQAGHAVGSSLYMPLSQGPRRNTLATKQGLGSSPAEKKLSIPLPLLWRSWGTACLCGPCQP